MGLIGALLDNAHTVSAEDIKKDYGRLLLDSVETAGHFDLDAELKIWVSSSLVVDKTFNSSVDVYAVQRLLASHVTKA